MKKIVDGAIEAAVFALPYFDWKGAHVYDGKMQEDPLMRSDTTMKA